jgi:hypothetical protein
MVVASPGVVGIVRAGCAITEIKEEMKKRYVAVVILSCIFTGAAKAGGIPSSIIET